MPLQANLYMKLSDSSVWMAKLGGRLYMSTSSKNIKRYICSACDGEGELIVSNAVFSLVNGVDIDPNSYAQNTKVECDICKGEGEVDWVTYVIDRQSNYLEFDKMLKKAMENIGRKLIEYSKT
jgi:hypothetical protein